MNRRLFKFLPLLAILVVSLTAVGGSDVFLDALLQRPNNSGTTVVPDHFLRRWDPLTIFFSGAKGPADGGPEDHPEKFATLTPDHPGAWVWLDKRTLQFRPAEPWPALKTVTASVEGRRTELFTLMAPPTRTTPSNGSTGLSEVKDISLSFTDPVPTSAIASRTTIRLRPLPGLGDDGLRVLTSDDFEVKALDRASPDDPATYALVLEHPIPVGTQATLTMALSLDTSAEEAVTTLRFATAEPFRARTLGCGGSTVPVSPEGTKYAADQPLRCSQRQVLVDFTVAPGALGPIEGRNLLHFDPAVEGLGFEVSGRRLVVTGAFADDQPYKVTLSPTLLRDTSGRDLELTGESEVHLYFPRLAPYLRWRQGQGIAEKNGPVKVPLEGRRASQVDLRIHKVDPLNRELWPFSARAISIDESSRPPGPGERPTALGETITVTGSQLRERLKALGSPGVSSLVDLPLSNEVGAARFGLDLSPHLAQISGARAPGHYLVGIRRLDGGTNRDWMRLQVTDLALSTIETGDEVRFFVSSLSSGAPVSGAKVSVDAVVNRTRQNAVWETVISGTTDGSGSFTWTAPGKRKDISVSVKRIRVAKSNDVLVLDPANAPERFANGHWGNSGGTWLGWAFASLTDRSEKARTLVHLFSERPVYRPEEDVHIKGYVRERDEGHLRVPNLKSSPTGTIVVRGPGNASWRLPVEITSSGSFYAKWSEAEVPTGYYRSHLEYQGSTHGDFNFQVEAYRLPTFEVEIDAAAGEDIVPNDRPFDVKAIASYYAGGKVAARPVRWQVTQYPYTWTPEALEGFFYSSDGRYARSSRFDSTPALSRDATTDRTGGALLSLDPGVEPTAQPRTYVIEATVTDADEQTVTATRRIHAVPAFVLGLKVPRVIEKNKVIPTEILVAGPDGKLLPDTEVTVRVLHRQWHSVLQVSDFSDGVARYVTDVVNETHSEQTVRSGSEPMAVEIPVDEAGVYVVELEARDRLGRVQVVTVDLYVAGDDPIAWSKPEAGVFQITADANDYAPGDTAKLLIRSPFQSGEALIVVEALDGNKYYTAPVRGGKANFSLPVKEGWVPRIPVHVLLRRGRKDKAPKAPGDLDLGKPQTLGATHWLKIRPVENTVDVTVENPGKAMPGETIPVTVTLRDPKGQPLAGEVTLWLVDQAVLSLGKEQRLDPKPDFLPGRRSWLAIHDTRNLALGTLPFNEMPGGDGEEEEGEDVLEKTTVRKDFRPVPYYEPHLQVGTSGTKTVQVKLPDNLTVFKLRAKVVSGHERFGVGTSSIRVRLPVVVQPDLPRFVRPGDEFEVAALGRVVEGGGGSGTAQVKVDGLRLAGSDKAPMTWDADLASRVAFPVTVPTPEAGEGGALQQQDVTVTIGAVRTEDGAADALEVVLPLRDDRRPISMRLVADLAEDGKVDIEALPEKARPGSVRRQVAVADHPGLVRMAGAMDVFVQRPARSTGQRLSRARAWIGMGSLREPLGLTNGDLVDQAVADVLGWLPAVLDSHELVGSWPGSTGQVLLTADALMFLVEARGAGYPVDSRLEAALKRALTSSLRSDYRYFLDGASWLERSRSLHALASAGQFDEAYFSELTRNARMLGPDGAGNVLLAAYRANKADSAAAQSLAKRLEGEILLTLYQGEERYNGLKSWRTDRNPLIQASEANALANIIRSLHFTLPESERLPHAVDALVTVGGEDGWGSPRADAAAMLALGERLRQSSGDPVKAKITEGGNTDDVSTAKNSPIVMHTSMHEGASTVTHKGGPAGVVFSTTRYIPNAPGSEQAAVQQGFVVSRDWQVLKDDGPSEKRKLDKAGSEQALVLGNVVEEHVSVVNPEARTYVAIEVPLAAGMEPLNPALATAPPEARPSKSDTRSATWVSRGDDAVTYYFEQLPKGTYDFYFRTRATSAGKFVQPAAIAELIYDPAIRGNSVGATVVVGRE